jgi:ELWxxDGT repeat protein
MPSLQLCFLLIIFGGSLQSALAQRLGSSTSLSRQSSRRLAGATLVADINPGEGSSFPNHFTTYNGKLYFIADNGIDGSELWSYDGDNNPVMVADIDFVDYDFPGSRDSEKLFVYDGKLYFSATDGNTGAELYSYDSAAGAAIVADINPGADGSYASHFTIYNGKLYFQAYDGTNRFALWVYDSTSGGPL